MLSRERKIDNDFKGASSPALVEDARDGITKIIVWKVDASSFCKFVFAKGGLCLWSWRGNRIGGHKHDNGVGVGSSVVHSKKVLLFRSTLSYLPTCVKTIQDSSHYRIGQELNKV